MSLSDKVKVIRLLRRKPKNMWHLIWAYFHRNIYICIYFKIGININWLVQPEAKVLQHMDEWRKLETDHCQIFIKFYFKRIHTYMHIVWRKSNEFKLFLSDDRTVDKLNVISLEMIYWRYIYRTVMNTMYFCVYDPLNFSDFLVCSVYDFVTYRLWNCWPDVLEYVTLRNSDKVTLIVLLSSILSPQPGPGVWASLN